MGLNNTSFFADIAFETYLVCIVGNQQAGEFLKKGVQLYPKSG